MKIYKTILMVLALIGAVTAYAQDYDVVLKGGWVMDPETSLDAVMNVGIKDGKIDSEALPGQQIRRTPKGTRNRTQMPDMKKGKRILSVYHSNAFAYVGRKSTG